MIEKKDVNYYMKLPYTFLMKKYPNGGYFAEVKELPGCITEADSKEEAFEMIEDAMKGWKVVNVNSTR